MNTTETLTKVLANTNRSGLLRYKKTHLNRRVTDFASYMDSLVEKRGLPRKDLFRKADIPDGTGYKILSGEIHTGDRDRLIRLLLALRPTLSEFQRALTLHQTPQLTPLKQRDAVLIYALSHRIYDADWINGCLWDLGEEPIGGT